MPADAPLHYFQNQDEGFQRWMSDNPSGWVVNVNRNIEPDTVRIHRSNCQTLVGRPHNGVAWTVSPKVCSNDPAVLKQWTDGQALTLWECSRCDAGSPDENQPDRTNDRVC